MKVIIADQMYDVSEHPLIILDEIGDEWSVNVWQQMNGYDVMTFYIDTDEKAKRWREIKKWTERQVKKWLK